MRRQTFFVNKIEKEEYKRLKKESKKRKMSSEEIALMECVEKQHNRQIELITYALSAVSMLISACGILMALAVIK